MALSWIPYLIFGSGDPMPLYTEKASWYPTQDMLGINDLFVYCISYVAFFRSTTTELKGMYCNGVLQEFRK
jgi:hypothetical protein